MAHPELYPILTYNQKVYFSIALVIIFLIISIIIKLKNKTKMVKTRQVNHKRIKTTFKIDCDEFVKVNFKKQQEYLYENKNRVSELIRLLNY